jgi:hypothetical protein
VAQVNRFYPTEDKLKNPRDLQAMFKQVLDQQYSLQDRFNASQEKTASASSSATQTQGAANTKLLGLNVTPIDTQTQVAGTFPSFIAKTGQITFIIPLNAVPPPPHNLAPGVPGQFAYDSGFFYVCIGVNSWARVAIGGTW